MSPRRTDARARVVAAAAEMMARHGLNSTSIREMARRADAPLGSTYHHFPGGKQQVVVEAVRHAGERVDAAIAEHLRAGPAAGLRGFLAMWRERLERSGFHGGCPVLAAAVEEPVDAESEGAAAAAAEAFAQWERRLSEALAEAGVAAPRAAELATLIVAGVEGAVVLARAHRELGPFDRVAAQLERLVAEAVAPL
ncbi:TetR/AcrR family transcriptional regulator [Luteimonas sp. Y-2-2-4F]|nr:TetR/AcrR family transcriptional regulator [Luteimonas sp. Y-2-2-4F]MCD9032971.1 TetR/AcrR family transcriptional regulator [Luteimonas sp. Y-2-2-4F]